MVKSTFCRRLLEGGEIERRRLLEGGEIEERRENVASGDLNSCE